MKYPKVYLKIKRRDAPDRHSYWEEFGVSSADGASVIDALMEIQRNPVTRDGKKTSPVVWDSSCHGGMCGACAMIINGKVRLACSTPLRGLKQPIVLEPMTKFPVVRDLWVDRKKMFDVLKKVRAWNEVDGYFGLGPGQAVTEKERIKAHLFSSCMTCGCCLEACPQFNERSPFMGSHALGQVALHNSHPAGRINKEERLDAIMGLGGIADCGNAQNCARVCPVGIPLTDAIAKLGWATTVRAVKRFFAD